MEHPSLQAFAALPSAAADLRALAQTSQRNFADVCATCHGRARGTAPLPEAVLEGLTGAALGQLH